MPSFLLAQERKENFRDFDLNKFVGIGLINDDNKLPEKYITCYYDAGNLTQIELNKRKEFGDTSRYYLFARVKVVKTENGHYLIRGDAKKHLQFAHTSAVLPKRVSFTDTAFVFKDTIIHKQTYIESYYLRLFYNTGSDSIFFSHRNFTFVNKKNFRNAVFADIKNYKTFIDLKNCRILKQGTIYLNNHVYFEPESGIAEENVNSREEIIYTKYPVSLIWELYGYL